MGRLTRVAAAVALALPLVLAGARPAAGFTGFGEVSAEGEYGVGMEFSVELPGGAPDRLELLIRTPESDATFVAPVASGGRVARYTWDTSTGYVTPNTTVSYRWRATHDGEVTLSAEGELLYDDDREGLDWQTRAIGEATVHWYGGAEAQALQLGELAAVGVERSERLLDSELAAPVDIFVYSTREAFFGALTPGVREWVGAAAFPELRTIFIWLEAGSGGYLESVVVHEVAHVVFHDATDNPYHEPPAWLNEGIATWMETQGAAAERQLVELEAGGGGLFAFEGIVARFPVTDRGGRLSYAQSATMVEHIIDRHGEAAIGEMAAAYRDGASDAEALAAGTGLTIDELSAGYFAEFGVDPPQAIEPDPILPSNVAVPPPGELPDGVGGGPQPSDDPEPAPGPLREIDPLPVAAAYVALAAAAALVGRAFARRAERRRRAS